MIGTQLQKPIQENELPIFEDRPVFETVVVFEDKTYTQELIKVNVDGEPILDEQGNVIKITQTFIEKEPKLDENGQVVTEQIPVLDESGNQKTERHQIGTEPNSAPNTLAKYEELAQWCNENNAFIIDRGDYYEAVAIPEPTAEELEAQALAQAKAERAEAVSKITVEVDGMVFDGDEEAQTRMGRTVSAALALGVDINTEKRTWVLHDNTVAQPTIAQLAEALRLAGEAQTKLWTVPYQV